MSAAFAAAAAAAPRASTASASSAATYHALHPMPADALEERLRNRIKRAAVPISAVFLALGVAELAATLVEDSTTRSHLMAGASVSSICCLLVIVSYIRIRRWRRHPAPLIFWRSVADLLVAVRYIVSVGADLEESLSDDSAECRWISGITQLGFLSAESWFAMISLDLLFSLTNPFTSYRANLKVYHAFAWGTGLVTALALTSVPGAYGVGADGFCWTTTSRPGAAWAMLFAWLVVYYACAVCVLAFGYRRLRSGVKETYRTRMRVLKVGMFCVGAYAVYWSVVLAMYFTLVYRDVWRNSFDFVVSAKGAVNLLVWVVFHDYHELGAAAAAKARSDDVDLSPQLNQALREEILLKTTRGITEAVRMAAERAPTPERQIRLDVDGVHRMRDFRPHVFASLRQLFDISDDEYLASLNRPANGQLSEGASGSFLFFSEDRKYVCKTISPAERDFLLSILDRYRDYVRAHPATLLTRFCGLHAIVMYRQTFTFVVMTNVLATRRPINARYDIKGSWVDRNTKPVQPGQPATCRHCNDGFVVGAVAGGSLCPGQMSHEPDTVLKDNDLKHRIQLPGDAAIEIIETLRDDSDFLCRLGVMDYSLLVGEHHMEFAVDPAAAANPPVGAGGGGGDAASVASVVSARSSDSAPRLVGTIDWRDGDGGGGGGDDDDGSARRRHGTADSGDSAGGRRSRQARERNAVPARVVVGPGFYYFGVIDMLQTWSWQKRIERFVKVWIQGKPGDGVSAMPPREYARRFQHKIQGIIEHQIFVREIKESPGMRPAVVRVGQEPPQFEL